jgi:hypothetical protein
MKITLNEVKAMNKIAGTQITKEQEIAFIKTRLNELEFDSQKELDDYKKKHKVRKGTELKVRSTKDKINRGITKVAQKYHNVLDKVFNTKGGKIVTRGVERGADWLEKQLDKI